MKRQAKQHVLEVILPPNIISVTKINYSKLIYHINVLLRLSLLKKSGEEEWKKRVSKPAELQAEEVEVKLREKRALDALRPHSIADRLNLLETSQIGWKGRVEENDAKRFTVAHKLAGEWVGLSKGVWVDG